LAAATAFGVALTFSPVDPFKALYWSAVINGVVAVPVMTTLMLMAVQTRVMGRFTISGGLRLLGWVATLAMTACCLGMVISWLV
jgi:Mn2+/Fe2+ NRAMP family transporter